MNEKGFSLVEMLVSITIVFMMSILVVPSFMTILIERKDLVLRNEGNILMQEVIYAYYHDPTKMKTEDKREGTVYSIQIVGKDICITWKNRKQREELICREIFQ